MKSRLGSHSVRPSVCLCICPCVILNYKRLCLSVCLSCPVISSLQWSCSQGSDTEFEHSFRNLSAVILHKTLRFVCQFLDFDFFTSTTILRGKRHCFQKVAQYWSSLRKKIHANANATKTQALLYK